MPEDETHNSMPVTPTELFQARATNLSSFIRSDRSARVSKKARSQSGDIRRAPGSESDCAYGTGCHVTPSFGEMVSRIRNPSCTPGPCL